MPIRESIVLFRNARSVMCRLAWLNWIMLNFYALLGVFEMNEGGGWEGNEVMCVCVCLFELRGGRLVVFSHFILCRSPSECGHGYRSGQHRPHF